MAYEPATRWLGFDPGERAGHDDHAGRGDGSGHGNRSSYGDRTRHGDHPSRRGRRGVIRVPRHPKEER